MKTLLRALAAVRRAWYSERRNRSDDPNFYRRKNNRYEAVSRHHRPTSLGGPVNSYTGGGTSFGG